MSKVVAPLLSFSASGQIANSQVYSSWKGRPYVRRYAIPANPQSTEQTITRSLFSWLNNVWKFYPGSAVEAWDAYADSLRITNRNAFIKQNLSPMRGEVDLQNMILSPSAKSGLVAAGMAAVGGANEIVVTLTAPSLPTGWAIVGSFAAAVKDQDPQTEVAYNVFVGTDAAAPYTPTITGLAAATDYLVGGWFKYTRPDGSFAYGQSLQAIEATL
jgi:hypothetical protein